MDNLSGKLLPQKGEVVHNSSNTIINRDHEGDRIWGRKTFGLPYPKVLLCPFLPVIKRNEWTVMSVPSKAYEFL